MACKGVDDPRTNVAGDGNFEWNAVIAEVSKQFRVVGGPDPMPDALRSALESRPYRFRSDCLAGMGKDREAAIPREREDVPEPAGGTGGLVAPDAEAHNTFFDSAS